MTATSATAVTATTAIAISTDRIPAKPASSIASGGPATHAMDDIARTPITTDRLYPEAFTCANSNDPPAPAGPPRTIKAPAATGKVGASANAVAKMMAKTPHATITPRYSRRRSAIMGTTREAMNPLALYNARTNPTWAAVAPNALVR